MYLDPPYVPLSATSSFTAYAKRHFGTDDQERLADALRGLAARKVPALLSNSDCPTTRELYRGFDHIDRVPARRAINSVGHGRGPVDEILVRSFDYPVAVAAPSLVECGEWDRWTAAAQCGPVDGVTRESGGRGRGRQDAPGLSLFGGGLVLSSPAMWCRRPSLPAVVAVVVAALGVSAAACGRKGPAGTSAA